MRAFICLMTIPIITISCAIKNESELAGIHSIRNQEASISGLTEVLYQAAYAYHKTALKLPDEIIESEYNINRNEFSKTNFNRNMKLPALGTSGITLGKIIGLDSGLNATYRWKTKSGVENSINLQIWGPIKGTENNEWPDYWFRVLEFNHEVPGKDHKGSGESQIVVHSINANRDYAKLKIIRQIVELDGTFKFKNNNAKDISIDCCGREK